MIILPAIDIKDKQCVRLVKGDYATAHQVAESPYETAKSFKAANASWIHMVDLDGAKERKPVNQEIFERVAKESGLKVEVGGGIRDMKTIEYYLERGIERVILGSVAVKNPELVKDGTLTGVNTEQLGRLNETVSCNIIASGGVSSIKDIEDCLELNLYGCICGKALYTGALNLEEAVRKAGVQTC